MVRTICGRSRLSACNNGFYSALYSKRMRRLHDDVSLAIRQTLCTSQARSQDFANGGDIHGSQLSLVPTCIPTPPPSENFLTCCLKWNIMVNFLIVKTQFTIYYVIPEFFFRSDDLVRSSSGYAAGTSELHDYAVRTGRLTARL